MRRSGSTLFTGTIAQEFATSEFWSSFRAGDHRCGPALPKLKRLDAAGATLAATPTEEREIPMHGSASR